VSLRSLSVSLLLSSGPLGRPDRLRLALRCAGVEGLTAGGSVADDKGIRPFALSDDDLRLLCRLAEETGVLARDPCVKAVVDTSDHASRILLHIAHEEGSRLVDLGLMSSGYEGADAPALQRFCARLLACAGLRDEGHWLPLTGRPGP
jgi:hypothetical protein